MNLNNAEKLIAVLMVSVAVGVVCGPWQGVGVAGALWLFDNWLSSKKGGTDVT